MIQGSIWKHRIYLHTLLAKRWIPLQLSPQKLALLPFPNLKCNASQNLPLLYNTLCQNPEILVTFLSLFDQGPQWDLYFFLNILTTSECGFVLNPPPPFCQQCWIHVMDVFDTQSSFYTTPCNQVICPSFIIRVFPDSVNPFSQPFW